MLVGLLIYARVYWAIRPIPKPQSGIPQGFGLTASAIAKTQLSNACRFGDFFNMFFGRRYVVRRPQASAGHKNCTRTRDKLSLKHIRSSAESVQ